MKKNDVNHMRRALQLAQRGAHSVAPNPMVGAVIVQDSKVIGEGYHLKKGEAHAEVNAVRAAESVGEKLEGSTLYCTLEPCCHTKKSTPPCTELIIKKKIGRVVIAALDRNPMVSGKGVEILRKAGIEVTAGVLEAEAIKQNKIFFKNMEKGLPYLKIKAALTLDGRVCSATGDSKWITSESARHEVHMERSCYDAIMVGVGTLRADNPRLNSRLGDVVVKENDKIIVGNLRHEDLQLKCFQATDKVINISKTNTLNDSQITWIPLQNTWKETLSLLYKEGICSIYTEGGSKLISSLLEEEAFDEVCLYYSKKLIGNGKPLFGSEKKTNMADALEMNGHWRELASGEMALEVIR